MDSTLINQVDHSKLLDNEPNYLILNQIDMADIKESLKIGFSDKPFPLIEGTEVESKTYNLMTRKFETPVTVSVCKLKLGDSSFTGIVTSRVEIGSKLFANGFGSHCYNDEAETMKKAVLAYCKEHGHTLVNTYNNWPSFRSAINYKS